MTLGEIHIYTDGACANLGAGGFAAILTIDRGHPPDADVDNLISARTFCGHNLETTNNRAELKAVILGISALKKPLEVHLHTDSLYVLDGITQWIDGWKKNGWKTAKKKPVKNQDLWIILDEVRQPHTIHWHHVAGHQTGPDLDEHARWNNIADELAVQERIIAQGKVQRAN